MANFLMRIGMWVKVHKELKSIGNPGTVLSVGKKVQILSIDKGFFSKGTVAFVGIEGFFDTTLLGAYIEPINEAE